MRKYLIVFIVFMFIFVGRINAYLKYIVGEIVVYNGVEYYVMENSSSNDNELVLLKAKSITVDEIADYLPQTEIVDKVDTSSSSARIAYYSKDKCVSSGGVSVCPTDYNTSDVKKLVDIWKMNYAPLASEARLITLDELMDNLGVEYYVEGTAHRYRATEYTPNWLSIETDYWTMTPSSDSQSKIIIVSPGFILAKFDGDSVSGIRPVIKINKELIDDYSRLVEYNNIMFYIINDDINNNRITLLKAQPVTFDEIKDYLSQTEVANKINVSNGYASMPYYSRDNCVSAGDTSG